MYSWKRFWCPENDSFSLADEGFLYDPDAEFGNHVNRKVVPFSKLHGAKCLVLLGEPGMGKSTAVGQEVAALLLDLEQSKNAVLAVNLGDYGDESRLIHDIFNSDKVSEWNSGSHVLHLFL